MTLEQRPLKMLHQGLHSFLTTFFLSIEEKLGEFRTFLRIFFSIQQDIMKKIQDILGYSRNQIQRSTELGGKFLLKNINTKVHRTRSFPANVRKIQEMYERNTKILELFWIFWSFGLKSFFEVFKEFQEAYEPCHTVYCRI